MLYFSEQNKQGMPCFSEHINGGWYTSQSKQTGGWYKIIFI
jgi:ubiquitin C-terminal hydrolase